MLYVDIKKKLPGFSLDVQLEVGHGRIGLLGASGSGKSMTLKAIAGIEKPDEGLIVLEDKVLFDSKKKINLPARERKVGYLFQNYALFPHMTVAQNIVAGMGKVSREVAHKTVEEMVSTLSLAGLENRYPRELSGGQQQRVAIGRMLAADPNILMFDEPFSALDYHLRDQMQDQLLRLLEKQDKTSLLVSHDIDEAYRLCHQIAVVNKGKIDIFDTKERIFESPQKLSAALITGCKNISKVERVSDTKVIALDWGVELDILPTDRDIHYIGIRAHHIKPTDYEGENTFKYQMNAKSETRFGKTILFQMLVNENAFGNEIRFDVDKEWWEKSGSKEYVTLPKNRLLLLE